MQHRCLGSSAQPTSVRRMSHLATATVALAMSTIAIGQSQPSVPSQIVEWTTPELVGTPIRVELNDVLQNTEAGALIPVTVVMRSQLNPAYRQFIGDGKTKVVRRDRITQSLKAIAMDAQAGLLDQLRLEEANGEAVNVRPIWLHNVVGVQATRDAIFRIANRQDIAYINYNRPIPSEDLFPAIPGDGGPGIEELECGTDLMGADEVWADFGFTGQGVVVGHIDSGVCSTHPDIVNQLWSNPGEIANNGQDDDGNGFVDDTWGWAFDINSNQPEDFVGHGSHTAGTVAGDGTQGTESGVAPNAEIMVLRVSGSLSQEHLVWEAMQYAVDNGADLITCSMGWAHDWGPDRATWRSLSENAMAAGVVTLFAGGNEGCGTTFDNIRTPGDVPDMITVGATNCNDRKAGFSSCGPVEWEFVSGYNDFPYPPGKMKPTISAPGDGTKSHKWCSGYTNMSGTSMATPHAAGAVALMLEANPALDHFDIKQMLKDTSVDLGSVGHDNEYGAGRVDAYAAVLAATGVSPSCLDLQVENLVAGQTATFTVSKNVVRGEKVAVVWGLGGSGTTFNNVAGYCAEFGFDLPAGNPSGRVIDQGYVGIDETFVTQRSVPSGVAGMTILFQAAKHGTCPDVCMSHVIDMVVQ